MRNEWLDKVVASLKVEMQKYLDQYVAPRQGETLGIPWSKERVKQEIEEMAHFMVEPYECEYLCDDSMVTDGQRLPIGMRNGCVVAADGKYALLYDFLAKDYVLVHKGDSGQWFSWGIRGDACSTFLAR